jgi:hypothetical protein
VHLPPLRIGEKTFPVLAEHFIAKHAQRTGKPIDRVEDGVLAALQQYGWPGNVRELENTIERAVVLSSHRVLTVQDVSILAPPVSNTPALPALHLHQNLEWAERETVRQALEQSRGVKKDAAELMGISQRALSYYLRQVPDRRHLIVGVGPVRLSGSGLRYALFSITFVTFTGQARLLRSARSRHLADLSGRAGSVKATAVVANVARPRPDPG